MPAMRRRIVVRRIDGRLVLFTEEAVAVYEAEREREAKERTWNSERRIWLGLAKRRVGAREQGCAACRGSDVGGSRGGIEGSLPGCRRARRPHGTAGQTLDKVASIRREQAAALYRASGSAIPPPDEVVALHRAWSEAALRSHGGFGRQVELVAAGCCAICARDNGRTFRISAELRGQRLPHAGCPKGLCQCDWWPLPDSKGRGPRGRRRTSPAPTRCLRP